MFPLTLTTNEVKSAAGVEREFQRLQASKGLEFGLVSEVPNLPHRISLNHQEQGVGVKRVRRSVLRVDLTSLGVSGQPVVSSSYNVTVVPVGDLATLDPVKEVVANLISLLASTGADTTIKFDGSGTGASALIAGTQ